MSAGRGRRDGRRGAVVRGTALRRATLLAAAAVALLAPLLASAPPARADFRHARMGARPRALGSAFVALADDPNAAYWNPAGLALNDRLALTLTRAWLYDVPDVRNDYACFAAPAWHGVHLGASWVRLGATDLYSEDTINLAAAVEAPFCRGLALGAAGKLLRLDAPGYEAYNDPAYLGADTGFSFDLGLHYDGAGPWTLGAVLYNVNEPALQLLGTTTDPDPTTREWAAGGSYLFRDTLLVTIDTRSRRNLGGGWLDCTVHGGAEIWFFNALALRAGLNAGLATMGVGLQDVHWEADFTLETNRPLGNVYMLSFTVRD